MTTELRKSRTMARIRAGEVVRTAVLGHYIPSFICHAAEAGYDCIWLDMEHRTWTTREIQSLMPLFHLYDIDCMLRPASLEKTALYRFLEDGATGLMIPHVSTEEKARFLADAVKFPPIGDRGLDNAGLDSGFHQSGDAMAYAEWVNRETFLTVQIETPEAVENVDAIAATEGVDLLFVGPGDLGLRLALAGDEDGSQLEAAFEKVAAAAKRHGKAWGCPAAGVDVISKRREQGAQYLANTGDFMTLKNALNAGIKEFE